MRTWFYLFAATILALFAANFTPQVAAQQLVPAPAGPPLVPPENAPGAPNSSQDDTDPPAEEIPPAVTTPYVPSEALQVWLTQFVLKNIPHEYEDKRKWGMTTHVWDGLKISHDGLQIKTRRRRKEVNDGTWKMYRAELLDPAREFHVRLENLHDAGQARAGFDLVISAHVHAFGRMTKYVKGVQLISLSANADAVLQLRLRCRLALRLDASKLPPDVLLAPEVTDAELKLVSFRLHDISDVGGSVAKELGKGVRNMLEDKIQAERRRLPEKINRQIDKNRDKLRVSLADLLSSEWSEMAKFLDRRR